MWQGYEDIRSLIKSEPLWFDENRVPRYCEFAPRHAANIHAREAAFLLIACQFCARNFSVCYTHKPERAATIAEAIRENVMEYGDPPNVRCCAAGPVATSRPIRVLQYWTRKAGEPDWVRDPSLEIEIFDRNFT